MTRFSLPEYRRRFAEECEANSDSFETNNGDIVLDEHQQRTMIKAAEALVGGQSEFSIVHPCGSGKTILEAALVKSSQEAKNGLSAIQRNRRKDLIITVERSLMAGIRDQIERVIGREIGIWGNREKKLEPGIVIASIQALQHHGHNLEELAPENVSLVIGDEADKFITENRAGIIDQFRNAVKIGLTATPQWPDKRHISTVWGDPVDTMSLREGIERGINASALFYMYRIDVNGDNIPVERGDYQNKALGKAMKSAQIESAICNIYDQFPRRERKNYPTLIYVPTLQILEDLQRRMRHQFGNLQISSWNGNTSSRVLENETQQFQEGDLDILILCEMGGRGLNLPRARLLIDASPTLSRNKLEQRHGRVLRTIRPGSPEAAAGFQKRFSTIYQILPEANRFRPVTLLDVLRIPLGEYTPGKLLPIGNGGNHGPGDDPEVRRLVRHFKSRPIRSDISLIEASDLRDILTREDLPTLNEDGSLFFYR